MYSNNEFCTVITIKSSGNSKYCLHPTQNVIPLIPNITKLLSTVEGHEDQENCGVKS